MGAVLLEHSHGQDKQRPVTIQGIDIRPRQFFYREDLAADRLSVRALGAGALADVAAIRLPPAPKGDCEREATQERDRGMMALHVDAPRRWRCES